MDRSAVVMFSTLITSLYHHADSGSITLLGAGLVAVLLFTSVLITLLVWLRYLAAVGLIVLVIRVGSQWLIWSVEKIYGKETRENVKSPLS